MNENKNIQNLEVEISQLKLKIDELNAIIKFYEEQFRLARHKQFDSSSEKTDIPEQISLFDEVENTADKKQPKPTIEEITYKRKKRIGKREEDLSNLPVETITYTIPESEQICPKCGEALHGMTKEIRRELTIIPHRLK